jgi:hypothetical protein
MPINYEQEIVTADYILDRTVDLFVPEELKNVTEGLRQCFTKYINKFKMIAEIRVFDGSSIYVYKKIEE